MGLDCDRCWAESFNRRLGTGLPYSPESTAQVEFHTDKRELLAIMKMRNPAMIVLGDMLDLHADFVPESCLVDIYATMITADQHIFQISTKRPYNMAKFVEKEIPDGLPKHIWVATSVGGWLYKHRIDQLRQVKAKVRFVNFEPLIDTIKPPVNLSGINQAIIGGESGHNYRPMNPSWARELLKECRRQDVAFYFKQDSGRYPGHGKRLLGHVYHEFPYDVSHWRKNW